MSGRPHDDFDCRPRTELTGREAAAIAAVSLVATALALAVVFALGGLLQVAGVVLR